MRGELLEGTPQNLVAACYQDWGQWGYLQRACRTGLVPLGVLVLRCGPWEQVFSGSSRRGRGEEGREPGAGPITGSGRTRTRGSSER